MAPQSPFLTKHKCYQAGQEIYYSKTNIKCHSTYKVSLKKGNPQRLRVDLDTCGDTYVSVHVCACTHVYIYIKDLKTEDSVEETLRIRK